MANGEIVVEIRNLIREGCKISPATRDRLILAAIADIYGKVEIIGKDIQAMKPWIGILKWVVPITGGAILMFLFGLLTHTVNIDWPY